jgi:hypothetical protein
MTERRRSRHAALLSRIVVAGASASGMFGLVAAMSAAARPPGPSLVPLVVGEVPAVTSPPAPLVTGAPPAPLVTGVPAPVVTAPPAPVVTAAPPVPDAAPQPAPHTAPSHRSGRTTRS